jgi:hypothetical protein
MQYWVKALAASAISTLSMLQTPNEGVRSDGTGTGVSLA